MSDPIEEALRIYADPKMWRHDHLTDNEWVFLAATDEVATDLADAALEALAALRERIEKQSTYAEEGWRLAKIGEERLAERDELLDAAEASVVSLKEALRITLDCKGPYSGTVTDNGGRTCLCVKCEAVARAALASSEGEADA